MWSQLLHLKKRCCDSIAKDYWQLSLIVPGVVLQKGWAWELFRCSHCNIFVNLVNQKLCQWNSHKTFNFFTTMLLWNVSRLLSQNYFVSESGVTLWGQMNKLEAVLKWNRLPKVHHDIGTIYMTRNKNRFTTKTVSRRIHIEASRSNGPHGCPSDYH